MELEIISRAPAGAARPSPLLFVHGMWHGAWCWAEHYLDWFAARGYAAHALSLRGHGRSAGRERLRWNTLRDYAADVAQAAAQMGGAPVLVGHSMGGAVVQKYLETHAAPAAVLLASVPPGGLLPATLRVAGRHPLTFLKVNLTLSMYPVLGTPALCREMMFSRDMPEAEVRAWQARMQDESYRAYLDMLGLDLPRPRQLKTPLLVLGAENDAAISVAEVHATARAYGVQAEIFPRMAHDMMLEAGWEAPAQRIAQWLAAHGL